MVFHPPPSAAALPEVPDSISVEDFMYNDRYGRHPTADSRPPYVCGLTGKTYSAAEVVRRVDHLARAIAKRLGFDVVDGTEWDKVVCLYSVNTIDFVPFTHALHRLGGIVTPASAAYSAADLEHQLRSSGSKALFTCLPLLDDALQAAKAVGIPDEAVFLLPVPGAAAAPARFKTVDDLVDEGSRLPELPRPRWTKGQGARQTAFLCFSSGTSGLPKAVMISHRNFIANVMQCTTQESATRARLGVKTQVALGLLPFSHIYGLGPVTHLPQWRGDSVIVLPRFELASFLQAVQRFRIQSLVIVPPILLQMLSNQEACDKHDLSSVRVVISGAAPLGIEVSEAIRKRYTDWKVIQAYGMTECSPTVTWTNEDDIIHGSSGPLLPGALAKVIDADGKEVTKHETRGELLVQSPSVVLGYLHNEKANAETFVWHDDGRWLRTGDEVVVRRSERGTEHFVVVDRIKELIKVKGFQVAPAELEAHLLAHPDVADCAVIPVPHPRTGEAPKAFIVRSAKSGKSDDEVRDAVSKHVEQHKARHKWLVGGVEFIEAVPKSASGKILRRMLRDREREARARDGSRAKL